MSAISRTAKIVGSAAGVAGLAIVAGGALPGSASPALPTPKLPSLPYGTQCVSTPAPPANPLPVSGSDLGTASVAGGGGSLSVSSSKGATLCMTLP